MHETKRLLVGLFCVWAGHGCLVDDDKCDEHQVMAGDPMLACVCEQGYVPSAKGYGCERCGEHERALSGKCVCEADYARSNDSAACEPRTDAGSMSEPQPSGVGKACESDANCPEDAPYCETFMSHTCIINDCLQKPSKCVSDSVCCDLSSLIGQSLCVPTSALTNGKCYGGTNPVTP